MCACGNAIEGKGSKCGRCAALDVLELGFGAADGEIKAKYRMLVKVWHPDRFEGDRELMQAAGEKLKRINAAFKLVSSSSRPVAGRRPPKSEPKEPAEKGQSVTDPPRPSAEKEGANRPTSDASAPPVPPVTSPQPGDSPSISVPQTSSGWSRLLRYVVIIGGVSLAKYFWPSGETDPNTNATVSSASFERRLFTPRSAPQVSVPFALGEFAGTSSSPSKPVKPTKHPADARSTNESQPTSNRVLSYFTVGSTREEVLAIQGTPTAFAQNTFKYGWSEVYFKDDRVVSWLNQPSLNPLRVKLSPNSTVSPDIKYFTVGSTKDEVVAVQGTPTAFSQNTFKYGWSEVYFKEDRVVSWLNQPSLNPLRVKLLQ